MLLIPLSTLARAGDRWSGSGQIISGRGHGARLQMVVETDRGRIRTLNGPALDASFSGGSQTFQNSEGTWQIDRRGQRLDIVLYRGEQVIRYQLVPVRKGGASPQVSTVEKLQELGQSGYSNSASDAFWLPVDGQSWNDDEL